MPQAQIPALENSVPASREKGRRHFIWVTSLLVFLLALQASFNYLVNPVATFRSNRGLGPQINQRRIKVDLLRDFAPPPEILILGSSRVRNIDPELVGRTFGANAFNAGVQNGGPRDWFAFARYSVRELDCPLRLVMVGVDPDNFLRDTVAYNHAVYVTELRNQLPHPWRDWLETRKELVSPYLTEKSWQVLVNRFQGKNAPKTAGAKLKRLHRDLLHPPPPGKKLTPRADGYFPEDSFGQGQKIKVSLGKAFSWNTPFNPEAVEYWEALAALAAERHFTLIAFVIPMSPRLEDHLDLVAPTYRSRLRDARRFLRKAGSANVVVCEIDSALLNFDDYSDLYHPGRASSESIIRQVYDCARKAGKI